MSDNILDDSQLDEVNGGVVKGHNAHLPYHACKDGRKGELVSLGHDLDDKLRIRGAYKCSLCGKTGIIQFLPGKTNMCELN